MSEKKYYWLKLQKDFFKRHDIKIVESMPNGKDYILFYLKLLCESTTHEGHLRFSDTIPYNENMLATITDTNVDIVKSAIQLFQSLHMIEILDDGTYFMNEVQKMVGHETEWAKKKREYRQKQNLLEDNSRTKKDNVRQEIELEKEKEIELDIEKENNNTHILPVETKSNDDLLNEEFEKIWKLYPKKVGKPKALQKYKKFRTSKKDDYCTYGDVLGGLEKYLKYCEQNTWYSPKDGATWFNNQGWLDEYDLKEDKYESEFTLYNEVVEDEPVPVMSDSQLDEFENLLKEFRRGN